MAEVEECRYKPESTGGRERDRPRGRGSGDRAGSGKRQRLESKVCAPVKPPEPLASFIRPGAYRPRMDARAVAPRARAPGA